MPTLATSADLPALLTLTAACVASMRAQGIEQWDAVYPAASDHSRDIDRGTLHVLRENGHILASITIDDQADPMWAGMSWHPDTEPFAAVHRLMVHPAQQRRGLARLLMAHAEAHARRENRRAIRLDTFSANPIALAFYERLGYRRTGTVQMRKGDFIGFEKLL